MSSLIARSSALLALLVAALCGSSFASTVIVPDDFGSIQAAIASGTDTVLVREGTYPETPEADRGVTLRGISAVRPRLAGLRISNPNGHLSRLWNVSRVDFYGRVEIATNNFAARLTQMDFTECALDSGLQHVVSTDPHDILTLSFTGCRLSGKCDARATNVFMASDTIDVGVSWGVVDTLRVAHCWFRGGPEIALDVIGDGLAGVIANNLFTGYATGIYANDLDEFTIASNTITNMSATGINLVSGRAIVLHDNYLTDCGSGIRCDQNPANVYDNTVIRSSGTGIWFLQPDVLTAERNIVIDSGEAAIAVLVSNSANLIFRRNTLVNARTAGIDLLASVNNNLVVENNIIVGSEGWGMQIPLAQAATTLHCNDWFENANGAVLGASPGTTDLYMDPMFCNIDSADVALNVDSPLLDQPACGLIGAKDKGCGVTATLLQKLRVIAGDTDIVLEWAFGPNDYTDSWIERASGESGPWNVLGTGTRSDRGEYTLRDVDVHPGHGYCYRVGWRDGLAAVYSAPVAATIDAIERLSGVQPNPAEDHVAIEWTMLHADDVSVRIYDLSGREVARVVEGRRTLGRHRVLWNGQQASGVRARVGWYVARIIRGSESTSHSFLLLR